MIPKSEIPTLWTAACPSFGPRFRECCFEDGEELLFVLAGSFARHLLEMHRSGETAEFLATGAFIERLLVEGDDDTREFATIGILEGIQNVWSHTEIDPELFFPFLLPSSRSAWQSLNNFWRGSSRIVTSSQP